MQKQLKQVCTWTLAHKEINEILPLQIKIVTKNHHTTCIGAVWQHY